MRSCLPKSHMMILKLDIPGRVSLTVPRVCGTPVST